MYRNHAERERVGLKEQERERDEVREQRRYERKEGRERGWRVRDSE